jgi:hypothetical protein
MAKFKREVKEMTTEPSVEPKMKKGGNVKKMAMGGMGGMPPRDIGTGAGPRRPLAQAIDMPRPRGVPSNPGTMPRPMMKKGGEMESPAMHKAEMKALSGVSKELKSHEGKPASKAHKGLKTGGVANAQGGYKSGGAAKCDYKTGGVANAQGGYKTGGAIKPSKYKEGGHVSMRTDSHGHNAMKKMSNC